MYGKQEQKVLYFLDDLIQSGKYLGRFLFDLIYFLRDLLLYKSAPSLENILERAMINDSFTQLAETVTVDWIQDAIMQMNQCQQEIKWTNSPKVLNENTALTVTNR